MGFPSCYTEDLLPKFLINTLSILDFIRAIVMTLMRFIGLPHFLEPEVTWPEPLPQFTSQSASLIRELIPVMKFSDVGFGSECESDPAERCAVCLYDFQGHEEIRRLPNCQHIFHKGCVDRWMDHDQKTCPLCRAPFVPDELVESFNDKLRACPSIAEFGGEFTPMNTFL